MFINSASLILFFKIINLFSVIVLAVIGFKKYGVVYLEQQQLQDDTEFAKLNEQKQNLALRQHEIDDQSVQQEQQIEILLQKIQQWQVVEQKEQQQYLEKKEQREKLFNQQAVERQKRLMLKRYTHKAVPQVIASCEEKLKKEFSEENSGHAFLQELIGFMKETS